MEIGTYIGGTGYIEEVAAYIRVSTQEQKMHGISLDAQVEKLEEYAKANNLKIVEWYKDEGVSARKLIKKRPELQRMIHDAEKKKFKRIIFIKLDRFFRSVAEYHECMKILDANHVTWTATEEKYDLSTANGRAFVNMKIVIAELEADQTSERIKIVNDYKVKEGLPLFGTQSLPICFCVKQPEPGERHKYIDKDPKYEALMYDAIAYVLKYHSVRGAMTHVNAKYGLNVGYNVLYNALQNEMLMGTYKGNPNYCPPYVDAETFAALQRIIKNNIKRTPQNRIYLFSGLITCPECGRRLTAGMHTNKRKLADGTVRPHKYAMYRCMNANRDKKCNFKTCVMEITLESKMLEQVRTILDMKRAIVESISESKEVTYRYNLEELEKELGRLNYSWQKGRIESPEEYDRQYEDLTRQIHEARAERSSTPTYDYTHVEDVLSGDWKAIYNELDPEHKRAFWRSFVEEIHLDWQIGNGARKQIKDIKFF